MIIYIDEAQNYTNSYTCNLCNYKPSRVIGRAYTMDGTDLKTKKYLFSYCAACARLMSDDLNRMSKHKY